MLYWLDRLLSFDQTSVSSPPFAFTSTAPVEYDTERKISSFQTSGVAP